MEHPVSLRHLIHLLKLLGVAVLYMLTAEFTRSQTLDHGFVSIIWPPSGVALAALLLGGQRYAWSILLGAFLLYTRWSDLPLPTAIGLTCGSTLEALTGYWLLRAVPAFDHRLKSFSDFQHLLLRGAFVSGSVGALIGATTLLTTHRILPGAWLESALQWWMGDALGILLVASFIQVWHEMCRFPHKIQRLPEGLLLCGLTFLVGQIVFMGWFHGTLGPLARGHWMFLMIALVGVRLGVHGTVGILLVTAIQALLGAYQGSGFFANDIETSKLFNYWSYMVVLTTVGMSLATYFSELRRNAAELRVAAITFECQEGLVVMNADSEILRVNQAFARMTGYTQQEVEGKPTTLLRSDRLPAAFYDSIKNETQRLGAWQGDLWHRRKNGEEYPSRLTCTAVRNQRGRVTHYVGHIIDTTSSKLQEQQRLQNEMAHRNLLVREVHHRIKNSLQGMIGILRQFTQKHPETGAPINQAIGLVLSMSVIHELQGRVDNSAVRLFELAGAIAKDIQNLWQTPVVVDIPSPWEACVIAEQETVPIALILNELILNAVKHGGKAHGHVGVALRKGPQPDVVQVTISNSGRWRANVDRPSLHHNGLQLVDSLMPHYGARLSRAQHGERVVTQLELGPPILSLDHKEP